MCNESPQRDILELKSGKFSLCKVFTGKPGIVKKIEIPKHKHIVGSNIYFKMNQNYNLESPYTGLATVFLQTNSLDEIKNTLKEIEKEIKIEIEDVT